MVNDAINLNVRGGVWSLDCVSIKMISAVRKDAESRWETIKDTSPRWLPALVLRVPPGTIHLPLHLIRWPSSSRRVMKLMFRSVRGRTRPRTEAQGAWPGCAQQRTVVPTLGAPCTAPTLGSLGQSWRMGALARPGQQCSDNAGKNVAGAQRDPGTSSDPQNSFPLAARG